MKAVFKKTNYLVFIFACIAWQFIVISGIKQMGINNEAIMQAQMNQQATVQQVPQVVPANYQPGQLNEVKSKTSEVDF